MKMAAGNEDADIFSFRKFHRDIRCVRYDRDLAVQWNAANDLGCCGSGRDRDGLAGIDESSSGAPDSSLFIGLPLHLFLKRTVLFEGLIKERLNGNSSSVGAAEQSLLFEHIEVAA